MQKTTNDIIIFLLTTTLLILIMGGFILTIFFIYRKRQTAFLKEVEQIKSDYEKNLLRIQLEIQEQTFQTISRDIHDNINLSLTLAKLNLNTINLSEKQKSIVHINSSVEFVSKAINDLTDLSRSMNSDIIIEQGLITALQQEINKLKQLDWFTIKFELTGMPVFMDAQKELFIFRIVQEAFNNILKHAHATNVKLSLDYSNGNVDITINDDGVGFVNSNGIQKTCPTAGLKNMQKRAELLSGVFGIESTPGYGTQIKITIPFNP